MKYDSFFDEVLFFLYSGHLITPLLVCWLCYWLVMFHIFLMKIAVKKALKIKIEGLF